MKTKRNKTSERNLQHGTRSSRRSAQTSFSARIGRFAGYFVPVATLCVVVAVFMSLIIGGGYIYAAVLSDGQWQQSGSPGTTTVSFVLASDLQIGDNIFLVFPSEATINAGGANVTMTGQATPTRTNNTTQNAINIQADTFVASGTSMTVTLADGLTAYTDSTFAKQTLSVSHLSSSGVLRDTGLAGIINDNTTTVTANVPSVDSDGDGVPDHLEIGDRDGDGIPDNKDFDPTGWFFDEKTGEIIPGGKIEVIGPGSIFILHDGSTGFYQWGAVLNPGLYTMIITYPPGYSQSQTCRDLPTPFAAAGGPASGVVLGHDQNGTTGFMTSTECTPYYYTFDANFGDPLILLNNIPLTKDSDLSATGQSTLNFFAAGMSILAVTSVVYLLPWVQRNRGRMTNLMDEGG